MGINLIAARTSGPAGARVFGSALLKCGLVCMLMLAPLHQAHAEKAKDDATVVYAKDIKAAMHRHLEKVTSDTRLLSIFDDVKEQTLSLRFLQIHDPVRQIGDSVYFACTDFHVDGEPEKIYDLDFWLRIEAGELKVFQSKIHKEPRKSLLYGWYKHPRYTFVNDEIEYLYSD